MSIDMSKKVDIYLKNPVLFQTDLENQKSIWMDNFVRPLGSHYEATLSTIQDVFKEAARRKQEDEARLAKIDAINGLVLSVLFAGIDLMGAAALKDVKLLSRMSSNKGLEFFLGSNTDTASAVKNFLSQSASVTDLILANLDDKIKGLVQTGTVTAGIDFVKKVSADVQTAAPSDPSASWTGAQAFQNNLATFYSTTSRSINEAFVGLVRDSKFSNDIKRKLIELFVLLPFVRPPTLSMQSFDGFFKTYYEVCYWCDYISSVPSLGLLTEKGVDSNRNVGMMRDGYLADTINERLAKLTGRYLTHTGGKMVTDPGADIRMEWDGYVTKGSQVVYLRTMRSEAYTKNIKPLLIAAATSTTLF
ncbi:MAG TPA: hypothetical protein PKI41_11590 [Candidatus Competibacteraceae bacterium]|nr:MAG: hypothetical protein EKK71_05955 [Candidatus Competibacteraceae bacterium]HOB62743.1 hypothetical protein [Candidatus Competibacteraceae bacterium]HQA25494.1 hypothetical protein [Candidatus Competibacteraceae bacterium]HQD55903.1 hypothetical protein [Candidatus Competibacteraceae bacterium]